MSRIYIYYIITTCLKFKSKLLINGFKFQVSSTCSHSFWHHLQTKSAWDPTCFLDAVDIRLISLIVWIHICLKMIAHPLMEWLKDQWHDFEWLCLSIESVELYWLDLSLSLWWPGSFASCFSMPKSNPWQRCTLLRPAGGCFRHDSGCEIVEIHHHMPSYAHHYVRR